MKNLIKAHKELIWATDPRYIITSEQCLQSMLDSWLTSVTPGKTPRELVEEGLLIEGRRVLLKEDCVIC